MRRFGLASSQAMDGHSAPEPILLVCLVSLRTLDTTDEPRTPEWNEMNRTGKVNDM